MEIGAKKASSCGLESQSRRDGINKPLFTHQPRHTTPHTKARAALLKSAQGCKRADVMAQQTPTGFCVSLPSPHLGNAADRGARVLVALVAGDALGGAAHNIVAGTTRARELRVAGQLGKDRPAGLCKRLGALGKKSCSCWWKPGCYGLEMTKWEG